MQQNANTSTLVLSRDERKYIRNLSVKPKPASQHGNSKAVCWKYFGGLFDSEGRNVDEDNIGLLFTMFRSTAVYE